MHRGKPSKTKTVFFPFMHHVNVCTDNGAGHIIACDCIGDDGNRLARLPELYDALMYFVVNYCHSAFISNDECRLCPDKKCKGRVALVLFFAELQARFELVYI